MELRVLKLMGMAWQGGRIVANNNYKNKLIMVSPQKNFKEKSEIKSKKPFVLTGGLP